MREILEPNGLLTFSGKGDRLDESALLASPPGTPPATT
jgi:hypothetical protein